MLQVKRLRRRHKAPSSRLRAGAILVLAAVAAVAAVAGPLSAQGAIQTPYLDAGHWARSALGRAHGLGLTPAGFDPGTAALTVGEAAAVLDFAAGRAPAAGSELAAGWLARLRLEYPGLAGAAASAGESAGLAAWHLGGSVLGGYDAASGRVLGGLGYFDYGWSGARPVGDHAGERLAVDWSVSSWPGVAGRVSPVVVDAALEPLRWQVSGQLGPVGVWAGRRDHRMGGGLGGTVVVSELEYTAAGFHTARPLALPGFLRFVGPVRLENGLGKVEDNGVFGRPWLWHARLRVEPHPRFELAINRAVMFGGEGNTPVTLRNLLVTFYGDHSGEQGEFDNQVVAVEARYRLPIDAIPLVLHGEWGFEDAAGAWKDVPGYVVSLRAPALPGASAVGLGVEWTSFDPRCCGNPKWYRNWSFIEGWTNAGRAIGHPLGGHGSELRVAADWTGRGGAVQLEVHGFRRDRGDENLFAPQREGTSAGGLLRLDAATGAGAGLLVDVEYERGQGGWRTYRASAGARWLF